MHIALGLLTSILTILYLLDRLGVDVGWLNPFAWHRRRAWARKYEGDPIYSVEDPIHVAAILITGVAKLDGDLGAEQRQAVLAQFEQKFSMSPQAAKELMTAATHLLGAPQVLETQLNGLADKHKGTFNGDQADSLFEMLHHVATVEGEMSATQKEFVDGLRSRFMIPKAEGTWA